MNHSTTGLVASNRSVTSDIDFGIVSQFSVFQIYTCRVKVCFFDRDVGCRWLKNTVVDLEDKGLLKPSNNLEVKLFLSVLTSRRWGTKWGTKFSVLMTSESESLQNKKRILMDAYIFSASKMPFRETLKWASRLSLKPKHILECRLCFLEFLSISSSSHHKIDQNFNTSSKWTSFTQKIFL